MTNGKGSRRRPCQVSEEELAKRWDKIFQKETPSESQVEVLSKSAGWKEGCSEMYGHLKFKYKDLEASVAFSSDCSNYEPKDYFYESVIYKGVKFTEEHDPYEWEDFAILEPEDVPRWYEHHKDKLEQCINGRKLALEIYTEYQAQKEHIEKFED